jgi:hypothetical protein
VRGPAITEVTSLLLSTQASAKCAGFAPRASAWRLISCAISSDSGRHSVCIMRGSWRPARVPWGGGTSGAYFPVSTPRASGE